MTYLLIVFFMISGPCPKITVDQIEFTSLASCQRAGLLLYGSEARAARRNMRWECVRK